MCNLSPWDFNGHLLQAADLLVWDEAPMSHRCLVEARDRTLQDIMSNDAIFGGKLLILAGDFRQILPVVRRGCWPDIINSCLTKSSLWQHCIKLHLWTRMRIEAAASQSNTAHWKRINQYAQSLINFGEGCYLPSVHHPLYHNTIELQSHLCATSEEEVINYVYAGVDQPQNHNDPLWLKERAILTCTNNAIDRVTEVIMA